MNHILDGQLQQAEFYRVVWFVTPPAGSKLDPMLQPDYWRHVAKRLKVGAQIEITPEDAQWFARLIVRSNTASGIKVGVLEHVQFDAPVEKPAKQVRALKSDGNEDFEVKFAGADKWRVLRRADGEIVARGLASREEALEWVERESTVPV